VAIGGWKGLRKVVRCAGRSVIGSDFKGYGIRGGLMLLDVAALKMTSKTDEKAAGNREDKAENH
jgi:hypothetical protein